MKKYFVVFLMLLVQNNISNVAYSANYYFDSVQGKDCNMGNNPEHALRSLSKIKGLRFFPGDSILLKSGCIFKEKLFFSGKGSEANPIVIGKYGGKAFPHLKGNASEMEMVHIYNSEHIVVKDLEISNKGTRIRPRISGLLVEIHNYGKADDIIIDHLYIHDVYGSLLKGEGYKSKDAGGGQAMMLRNYREDKTDTVLSYFNGLTVENCHIKDCQRNGIIMWGNWMRHQWLPNLRVLIKNNIVEGVPGDGIVPTACDGAIVEYNVMKNCPPVLPATEACDGIWPFSSDNTTVRYNIVSDHKSQTDGYAYDSDYNCINSVFEYNLSYNNEGGFLLLCNSGGWPKIWSVGNVGTIVRYNVSINDGIRKHIVKEKQHSYYSPVIHITGPTQNSRLCDNIFYLPKKELPNMDKRLIHSDSWRGYADSTFFQNNYIYVEEATKAAEWTSSTNNFVSGNKYVGDLESNNIGFMRYHGAFNKEMWYNGNDANWRKLVNFLEGKSIIYHGKKESVLKILGY
jgi:hypothetical protein